MDCGNRFTVKDSSGNQTLVMTGAGIELHDCILYVQGNLDLSSTAGHNSTLPTLRGTNATVIVDGTLIVSNGSVTGSTEGMVLMCRRLVSMAKGTYKGLIMVQKSAAFFPASPGDELDIQGGLVCGAGPMSIYGVRPDTGGGGGPVIVGQGAGGRAPASPSPGTALNGKDGPVPGATLTQRVTLQGLHLWSTHLQYDPRYLKTLNRFGPTYLMSLRPIE
jgi:hypothetical protein